MARMLLADTMIWAVQELLTTMFVSAIGMKLPELAVTPSGDRPMTQNALVAALRTMDVGREQMTAQKWCQTFEEPQARSVSVAIPYGPLASPYRP